MTTTSTTRPSTNSRISNDKLLQEIERSPFSTAVEWSYPPSPPIGFPVPRVDRGQRISHVEIYNSDGETLMSRSDVLEKDIFSSHGGCGNNHHNDNHGSSIAYELTGGLIHLTLCGEIRLCYVLQQVYPRNNESSTSRYQRTQQQVAIKMNHRMAMRHLHDDENGTEHPSNHHPFPENPWKEVSALQLLEKSTIGKCQHIIHLVDVMYDDEYLYEILPYYPNDLYWTIHRQQQQQQALSLPHRLDEPTARLYFIQLLYAMYTLHSHGVCHRDISSHNLLLDDDNKRLMLIDYGMCLGVPYSYPDDHYTEDVTSIYFDMECRGDGGCHHDHPHRRLIHSMSHCGKLRFMAPEIYACQDSFDGLSVDLWSAAVVLFEMLTGRLPYQKPHQSDAGYHDLMDEHYYWDPKVVHPMLSWGYPDISMEAVDLLKHMFRSNPQERLTLAEVARHPWVTKG
jgi:hypothetical protein